MQRVRESRPIVFRHLTVESRRELSPAMVRITLTGDHLDGFTSTGPHDHVKVFFPDPETGVLTAPHMTEEGVHRPTDGVVLSRDYTPLAFRERTDRSAPELDIDFVIHGDDGPASVWAMRAKPGDPLAIAGPRGSALVPEGVRHAVLVADETALPAMSRWIRMLPDGTRITAIVQTEDEGLEHYFDGLGRERLNLEWLYRPDAPDQLTEAVRSLAEITEDTYVWAAGESLSLIPVRRHFRRERGLAKEQVTVEGYWKRGVTNLDHHAPVDPSDPD